ncbi:MAG: hypothetical protein CM15mP128_0050 [Methanobacteriota archaeon]|nr:MAG: hypothetical protein CM15mP128_0050 [Euryarchaeota archaeon]
MHGRTARKYGSQGPAWGQSRVSTRFEYDAPAMDPKRGNSLFRSASERGPGWPNLEEHVQQRMAILADLQRRDIRDIQTVTSIIQNFYATR